METLDLKEKCYRSFEKGNLDIERIKELEEGRNFFDSDFHYYLGDVEIENLWKNYKIKFNDYCAGIGGKFIKYNEILIQLNFGYPEFVLITDYGEYAFEPSPSERQWLLAHVLINLKK